MQWGQAGKVRKYTFAYDNLSRLKTAAYTGESPSNFAASYTYDKQGNIKTLQRYGLTAASTYGIIDNLTAEYTGNQLKYVSDAANNFALNSSMDFKEYTEGTTVEYTYNANGAMVKDMNKGISQIQYNSLNLPRMVDIKNQSVEGRNEYTYSVSGQKLKVVQKWNPNYNTAPVIGSGINVSALTKSSTTDYTGNIIYENGTLKRILVDGGYYESGNYYFYINDHLGNNRIVANATASVVQSTQYYPFGMPFADATGVNIQPYKYNNKELDGRNGLNWYDNGARPYSSPFPNTPTPDPHAENYYSLSPYSWVGNNPMKFIDPTGMDSIVYNQQGELIDRFRMKGDDRHYMQYEKGDQKVIEVLSQESIKGDPREKTPFNGTLNESFITTKQNEIIAKGVEKVNGYLDIVLQSKTGGSMDYKPLFKAGELINMNGVYMNNHEALNYMWGTSMSEITYQDKADIRIDDALIGAQLFHMYDNVFGRSEGWQNQPNHNKAIKIGYNFNSANH